MQTAAVQQEHVEPAPEHQAEPVENQPTVRPRRVRKVAIDTTIYQPYLSEDLYNVGKIDDPANFK
jgi:hypothetical protein